ncbi:NUDIX hydrolase [Nocardiopsis composta]|uniref:8-oxo-dGTP pyrophosphatase MutT (NUDIX family) n=1 Tax=Nocardiopsis composta TaxID=157465 RepID=A0A7W8QQN8_9ACTN|nr:NUDIX hydrolase [Nocardiopsis composta]MBB5434825.1 8-oxo-dGTP pyrophosphatase MutT (NUDIX family) [Nocardiopsis composta]
MSLADAARAELSSWSAPDAGQERLRRAYLEHLGAHPDALHRSCTAGHITASAAVLDPSGTKGVLTLHGRIGLWLQTGGHCEDGDATLLGAALREAEEESGVTGLRPVPGPVRLDRHRVPCAGGTWHLDVQYAVIAPDGAALSIDPDESADLGWFPVDDLPEPTDDACRALFAAAAERVRSLPG